MYPTYVQCFTRHTHHILTTLNLTQIYDSLSPPPLSPLFNWMKSRKSRRFSLNSEQKKKRHTKTRASHINSYEIDTLTWLTMERGKFTMSEPGLEIAYILRLPGSRNETKKKSIVRWSIWMDSMPQLIHASSVQMDPAACRTRHKLTLLQCLINELNSSNV